MLLLVVLLLVVLWLVGGPVLSLGGDLVHVLLIIALIVLLYDLFLRDGGRFRRY